MKRTLLLAVALVAGACNLNVAGKQLAGTPANYLERAEFPTTIGLYPGSFVRQLGIDVGTVSKVENQGDHVLVTMRIFNKYHLAEKAKAILVGDSVLGERYVQFAPAYIGGQALAPGTTLGLDRVAVPIETDTVLRSLNTVLRGINPSDIRQFTANLATLLDGQGAKINDLILNASGTIKLLADKGNELGQLTGTLAQLTKQLGTKDAALANLVRDYDLLAQTLAANRGQLDGTISQLTNLTTEGASLLAPNMTAIQQDIAGLTSAGQILDRNIPAVDIGLKYAPRLFGGARNAYDPLHNWLPLNSQANPRETAAVLGGSVRDALASLCRRLIAKQSALAGALGACGDPNSGFFNPVIGLFPTVLGLIPGQVAPASAAQAFARGLAAIPGLTDQQRQSLAGAHPSAIAPSGPPGAAAVAALSASPVPTESAPRHHRGLLAGWMSWVGSLL